MDPVGDVLARRQQPQEVGDGDAVGVLDVQRERGAVLAHQQTRLGGGVVASHEGLAFLRAAILSRTTASKRIPPGLRSCHRDVGSAAMLVAVSNVSG